MTVKPEVFLDTSALFAAIWSTTGGGRMNLKLGEAGVVPLWVSSQVLAELENILRRKTATMLGKMTLVLERSGVQIVPAPKLEFLEAGYSRIKCQPGAQVLAAAWSAGCDYFVTLDRKHFFDNSKIVKAVPFPLGTPGDFLNWYKTRLVDQQEDQR